MKRTARTFDLCVVGSGFGGSLLAMIARRLGRSVVLIERGRHPRFAIGESSTPLANLLWEELAQRYNLPGLLALAKWGSWQRTYPGIACGLKRGFTFYHHVFEQGFSGDAEHSNELLVAASPRDEIADTHWYRADLDSFLVQQAAELGVEYLDQCHIEKCYYSGEEVIIEMERAGKRSALRSHFLVDASGPRGFLHRTLGLSELPFKNLPLTQGLYTHFTNVRRWSDLASAKPGPDRAIWTEDAPPYRADDAALHHVFDGGWIWVLRFNNGLTSAGVAAADPLANALNLAEGKPAWDRLLQRLPSIREQFAQAQARHPFVYAPRLSFRSKTLTGPGWVLLPSAAGFVDPLLSTGFPLALLGISRLAGTIEHHWGTDRFSENLADYANKTMRELNAAEQLIAALYANMGDFEMFRSLSLLYFAAASFSETARRLGRADIARSFLMCDHPEFGPKFQSCCQRAIQESTETKDDFRERDALLEQIQSTIEPINLCGLGKKQKRNWYPVDSQDLLEGAHKLGVPISSVEQWLNRSGFHV